MSRHLRSRSLHSRLRRCLFSMALLALILAACAPAMATQAPSAQSAKPATTPQSLIPAAPTQALGEISRPTPAAAAPAAPAEPTATTAAAGAPTAAPFTEERAVDLEWPARLRMGDSDVIRLALVPSKEGYIATAEYPDHTVQTKPVVVPRPNGYALYAVARLDGVAFEIDPRGDQERFVPEGEEVSWRWTLLPRKAGQQRLSVNLRLRWVPGPGVQGSTRESQVYARSIDMRVTSFLGLSPAQAAPLGAVGLLGGGGLLFASLAGLRRRERVLLSRAELLQVIRPTATILTIETLPGLVLSEEEQGLLRGLFGSYSRLAIENEFLSGYSGARTFLVRPIRADGCADALTIVKLGPRDAIRQEYENYEAFVKDRLPPVTARIQRPPVTLPDAKRPRDAAPSPKASAAAKAAAASKAAVQYTFIAEPGHPPASLRQALLQDPDPDLLLRLFETFGPSWWMQRRPYTFRLGVEYDRLLPPHFVLEPMQGAHGQEPLLTLSESENPAGLDLSAGSLVRVMPFRQAELRADERSYSLLGLPKDGNPALRLRWLAPVPPAKPLLAQVRATRLDLLRGWTGQFDRFGLLDPYAELSQRLDETVTATRSVIHGDLNLENVLVGPGNLVWLIDFAQTREGHPLFDFAHLASELIAHVLAPRAASPHSFLDLWQRGDDPLINAIHQAAGRCLFDPARPREYHLALYAACLGALKYPNLPPLSKHCLYLTAASISQAL